MKEREAQIELKKLREEGRANQDRSYLEKQQRDLEEQKRAEEEEKLRARLENKKTAEFQKAQCVTLLCYSSICQFCYWHTTLYFALLTRILNLGPTEYHITYCFLDSANYYWKLIKLHAACCSH